jgi:hypothetical protein
MCALFLWINTVCPKRFALIFAISVIDGNKKMCQLESPDPADRGAMGFDAVLRRVHAPLLASLCWLALGCVLGWQDKACVERRHEQEGESVGRAKPSANEGEP